jgi:thiopurine S-methyltransferase
MRTFDDSYGLPAEAKNELADSNIRIIADKDCSCAREAGEWQADNASVFNGQGISMEKHFWLERWQRGEIGFHASEVNAYLMKFWPELHVAQDSQVFVPLCGKSIDMQWLRQQGHPVLGVELSHQAAQDFFKEAGCTPERQVDGDFECFKADDICVFCGDFFNLTKEHLAKVSAVYDRASMVALPPDMRARYVKHLVSILPRATQILLIAFDYPQSQMQGPPFAISTDEILQQYRDYAEIRMLAELDVLADNPRFQKQGITSLQERIYLLTLR